MALDIRLYSASYVAELDDGSVYGIQYQLGSLGGPTVQHNYAQVWGRGFHPLAGVSYGNREITLTLQLHGSTHDDFITNQRNVTQMLLLTREYWTTAGRSGEKAVLFVQLNGQTNGVEFDVLSGQFDPSAVFDSMMLATAPQILSAPLTLTVKPFSRPQALTRVTSASITNGGGTTNATNAYQMTSPLGDMTAPIKLTFQSTAVVRRVIIGKKSHGNVANVRTRLECESATYAGYNTAHFAGGATNITEASGSNGAVLQVHATRADDLIVWTIDANLPDYYGDYRAFLRVKRLETTCTAKLYYGGVSGVDIANSSVSIASGGPRLVDLGKISIPHRIGPPDAAPTNFKMSLGWHNGTVSAFLDCLYIVPIDEDYMDVGLSAALATGDQIVMDNLIPVPSLYVQDSSGDIQGEYPVDGGLYTNWTVNPGRDNLFVPLMVTSTGLDGHNLANAFTLEMDYFPQYSQFRGT